MRRRLLAGLVVGGALLAACGGDDDGGTTRSTGPEIGGVAPARGELAWPAPPADQVIRLTEAAGLVPEVRESLQHHVHAHLDVFIDGDHRTVPAGLGIVISDPGVRRFDEIGGTSYGGIQGCDTPCISPLHTHDTSGVIHTESATAVDNTLGQLFTEWDVRLTATCIGDFCTPTTTLAIYVDGKEVALAKAGDIALTDGKEIAIVIGSLPDRIPSKGDFSAA
jgi:hypothetical protein